MWGSKWAWIVKPCQLSSLYFSSSWARCICVPSSFLSIEFRDDWNWCGFHTDLHLCSWVPAWSSSSSFHTHLPFPTSVLWILDSRIGHKYNPTEINSCIKSSLCNKSKHSLVILCLWLNPDWCGNYNQIISKIYSNSFRLHMGGSDSRIVRSSQGTPLQYSCLENPVDGGAWQAAVLGVAKSRTRLSDFTFTFHFYALEKEMATYSSVLAWRIPGTRKPGGLPSMGLHRVWHDWSDLAAVAAHFVVWANPGSNLSFDITVHVSLDNF